MWCTSCRRLHLATELHRAGLGKLRQLCVQDQRQQAMQVDGRRRQQARRHGLPVAVLQARHRRRLGLLLLPGHRSAKALRSQPWYWCGSGSILIDFCAVSQIASNCLRFGWVTSCRSAAPPGSKRVRGPGSSRFRRRLSSKLPPKNEAPGPLSAVPAPHRQCAVASMHFEDGKKKCFVPSALPSVPPVHMLPPLHSRQQHRRHRSAAARPPQCALHPPS